MYFQRSLFHSEQSESYQVRIHHTWLHTADLIYATCTDKASAVATPSAKRYQSSYRPKAVLVVPTLPLEYVNHHFKRTTFKINSEGAATRVYSDEVEIISVAKDWQLYRHAITITPSPSPPQRVAIAIAIATSPHQTSLNMCDQAQTAMGGHDKGGQVANESWRGGMRAGGGSV